MARYDLFYWSVPFRGQFVRAVLAFAQQDWREVDDMAISALMDGSVADMPVPFMGPLWTTIADRFSRLDALLRETAPRTLALSRRLYALPPLAALSSKARQDYEDAYAGGQIGASMAAVLDDPKGE